MKGDNENSSKTIDASPTKELFISMLIKDITLIDAIGDLIDNSVDGALSIRPNKDYKELSIKINVNKEVFEIKDNCGGISYEKAKKYAFRFGRSPGTPSLDHSLGQFGIGMKRALFKIGRSFTIESTSKRDKFKISINVNEWEKDTESWNFTFQDLYTKEPKDQDFLKDITGTTIIITDLNPDVKDRFVLDSFTADLIKEIELEHLLNIDRGLEIIINGYPLKSHQLLIINSDQYKPGYWEHQFETGLKVKAIVGVSESDLQYGGWYIFCNDRLIKGPEQTITSGWGALKPKSIPKYHNQFDRFRGYIYFEATDTSLLPWNTSKNNLDEDSPPYKFVRLNMIDMMRPVIDFLNKLHQEQSRKITEDKPLLDSLEKSKKDLLSVSNLILQTTSLQREFIYPPPSKPKPKNEVLISYYKHEKKVNEIMELLGLKNSKEVGERTFDYFYDNECEG